MTKIVIAEDHQLFRESLIDALFEYDIVGLAEDGLTAIQLVKNTNPDMLLLDLSLPRMSGIEVLKTLRPSHTQLKIIALTIHGSEDYLQACVDIGVDAFVLKEEGRKKLVEVIHKVLAGGEYVSPGIR